MLNTTKTTNLSHLRCDVAAPGVYTVSEKQNVTIIP
jgi:hypothetical protein